MLTKKEVSEYLKGRKQCDGYCVYKSFCPEYPPPKGIKGGSGCIVYTLGKLDSFYNIFFGESDGIKNELQRTLYKLESDGDPMDYLQACTKTMTTVYGTTTVAEREAPDIHINITPVDVDAVESSTKRNTPSKRRTKKE